MNPRLRPATPLAIKRLPAVGSPTDPDGGASPFLRVEDQTEIAPFVPPAGPGAAGRPQRELLLRKAVASLLIVTASFFVGAALFGPPVDEQSPVPPEPPAPLAPFVPAVPPAPPAPVAPVADDVLLTVTVPPSGAPPRRRPRRPRRPAPAPTPSDALPPDRRPIESRNPYAADLPGSIERARR